MRVSLPLKSVVIGVALMVIPATAQAQRAPSIATDEIQIDDQPGYVPGADEELLPAAFQRQVVFFRTIEPPGTIVIQTSERFLYVVQGNNRALRYGIGVGREGFQWSGQLRINRKAEWPDWTPPSEMTTLPAAVHGRRSGEPDGGTSALSWQHCLPHSRHQPAADDWSCGVVGLFPLG
jgi:lipoprotein-anchoring transpeptidase ErfK/SrfK